MKIEQNIVKVRDLVKGYVDNGDDGVFAFSGKLTIRPPYQREFVYKDAQRNAVIDSIQHGYPLNVMYWAKVGDDLYEVLDGQQRTISICSYVNKEYSINHRYWQNLTEDEQEKILDYEITVYVCEGTESEKLEWFRIINIAGEKLTNQELLNAAYVGPWLNDAKSYFSKRNSVAKQIADRYVKGDPIRQELLEKVLGWIADRDSLDKGQDYMAIHQHDTDANELWVYYNQVINWAKLYFPKADKLTNGQAWGLLYNKYKDKTYNTNELKETMKRLLQDDDVTKVSGIIPYLLSDRTSQDEKHLSLRTFSDKQKKAAYERQNHKCPHCLAEGNEIEYDYEAMQGDHIIPWSQGGRTVDDNVQMLCRDHNATKSGKY